MTPRTRERIVMLAKRGLPPRSIVAQFYGEVGTYEVYNVLAAARRADPTIPKFGAGRKTRPEELLKRAQTLVPVPTSAIALLSPHAERRAISLADLAKALLITIAQEGLVDATLDDGART
jgi:hypothetical protein